MSRLRTPPHLITLILLTGFSPLSLNMFLPSLANIAVDLETDYGTVAWAVSGYLTVTAIIQLIIGPMSDRIGRRPVLLGVLLAFVFASLGCVSAQNIEAFLLCRMLQGGIIGGYALSLAIVRDTRSEREAVSLIGYIGMTMAIAPMVGPMLGGLLDTFLGWRSIFAFYAASGFGLLILCWLDLGDPSDDRAEDGDLINVVLGPCDVIGGYGQNLANAEGTDIRRVQCRVALRDKTGRVENKGYEVSEVTKMQP
ncbi:MFS transporter [Phaeobacter inhibens]|uniref:MFS transporter n=1 Tax=Phaeobacter inhibens TaxID=221822 RepID=UPI00295E3A97|nr:MFS transporter [Phaeobacter inhibens]